jgi:hypothetical protein
MSDQEKKQETSISPQPNAENQKQSGELSDEALTNVTGGRGTSTPSVSEIVVTKPTDVAST